MVRKKSTQRKPTVKPQKGNCYFCNNDKTPNYKDYEKLSNFISDRAKIIARVYTGVCSRHQRELGAAVKRARHLGLLPYQPQV
jgi:small subunit ribosomal protein S18